MKLGNFKKINKSFRREYLFLLIIVLISAILRFWNLSSVPPSLSHDEVAIGYNAYSILKTGMDEYGIRFPLLFRSFDDYKLPGMVYITAPSIGIFGLNEIGVRFPSAFLGVLSVFIFYFIVKNLMNNDVKKSLVITLFFAFSIWHINFSRQSFESNGALFFLMVGAYFLISAYRKINNLYLASIFFGVALYFYYSVRLVIPFLVITFLLIYGKQIFKKLKILIISGIITLIIISPLFPNLFSQRGFKRINKVSIFNDSSYIVKSNKFSKRIAENDNLFNRVFYNRRRALIETFIENYLKNLSPKHIFFLGTGSIGLLYKFEIPLFFLGIFYLLKFKSSIKWIFVAWILSAVLPGALSVDQPNSLRTLLNAPMFSLLSGLGFLGVIKLLKNKFARTVFIFIFMLVFLFFLKQFLYTYFFDFPKKNAISFGDGYKQMVQYVKNNEKKYKAVFISGYYWRPYIFTLFWKKYDPSSYQKDGSIEHFDKYYFSGAQWDKEGIYFGPFDINFSKYIKTDNPKETLFILARVEFERNKRKFQKLKEIDGMYTKSVFVAGVLK